VIQLEELRPSAYVGSIIADCLVSVVGVQWDGSEALELTHKELAGRPTNDLLDRHADAPLETQ
jgi:hypothetical protein